MFDGQKATIEKLGPIEDYVRLLLILASAERSYDSNGCCNRLVEGYLYISNLDDLATKTSCWARLVATLRRIDPDRQFEPKQGIHVLSDTELENNITRLLDLSAEHYVTAKGIVRALAKANPEQALILAQSLNGNDRRHRATADLIASALQSPLEQIDFKFIRKCLSKLTWRNLRDESLVQILVMFSESEKLSEDSQNIARSFIGEIDSIEDAVRRCNAYCLALDVASRIESANLMGQLFNKLEKSWQAIDVGWVKVDVGFKIVEALSGLLPDEAKRYLKTVEDLREELLLDSDVAANSYLACLRLAIRAYSGLLTKKLDTEADLIRIYDAIDKIPSSGERIGLYTELALRYWMYNRREDTLTIVNAKIKPLLQQMNTEDNRTRQMAIVNAAPALYQAHTNSALTIVEELPFPERDSAYSEICSFILKKKVSSDP
jgi:hypothetical protein